MTTPGRRVASTLITLIAVVCAVAVPAAAAPPQPGTYVGQGFDACTAPASATMDSWLASPYRAIGVYIGGDNRACTQPQLTTDWVTHQQAEGWHLLPIYLGLQAPCTTSNKKYLIDPLRPAAEGRAEADSAIDAAAGLGLPAGSTLYFDMEAYATSDTACTEAVLRFLGGWTVRLHDRGYSSGVYGSLGSTVRDLVADYASVSRPHPDHLWFARYDNDPSTSNPAIPDRYWSPHRRIHQYRGGHNETYGGATINIDNDAVDVAALPGPRFNDFTGNGWTDLLARDDGTGDVFLYPGQGAGLESRTRLASGWTAFDAITRFGDFDRAGHDDLIARDASTGNLWLYPGTGSGLGPRIRLGSGWNALREITPVGDLTGDGYPDLLAIGKQTGTLYLYPGRGTGLGRRLALSTGWKAMSQLTGIGNLTGDSHRDLLARQTSTGRLFLYPGREASFGSPTDLGSGWKGRRGLVGVGDFNRDGSPDLMAIDSSTGSLFLYPGRQGRPGGLQARIRLGGGWTDRSPIF